MMPWWGNESLAEQFATAVGASLGTPIFNTYGPSFARNLNNAGFAVYVMGEVFWPQNSSVNNFGFTTLESGTYAIATLAPPPAGVPGPLPLFGVAAAFGMSRRLRRKIQLGG